MVSTVINPLPSARPIVIPLKPSFRAAMSPVFSCKVPTPPAMPMVVAAADV